MFEFPELPQSLEALSDTDLDALRAGFVNTFKAVKAATVLTAADNDAITKGLADFGKVKEELARRATATAEFAATAEGTLGEVDAVLGDEDEAVAEDEPEDDEDEDEEDEEVEDEAEPVLEPVGAASNAINVSYTVSPTVKVKPQLSKVPAKMGAEAPGKVKAGRIMAMDNVSGKKSGEAFADWTEFSLACYERAQSINPASGDRVAVGRITADYPADRVLADNVLLNLAKFERDELIAAMCAPCTPYYNLACMNTTRRPVFNSLPGFQAPRGCVSIYPSPSLSDIDGGYGQWTNAMDSIASSTKDACQTIECATPSEYRIYGIYRCLTVKNLLQLTYPELVEAYLNRLAAATARFAEIQLLEAMAANVNTITMPTYETGASVSLVHQLLRFLTGYQERERWDTPQMEGWGPRWLIPYLKADLWAQRITSGARRTVPTDAEINSLFSSVGISMNWFIDRPSWADAFPVQTNADGNLATMPTGAQILVAPQGKFALMDRGELRVGVTGNNIYRDNTSNSRNEFTFFFENFEGIVDTTSCPADLLDFTLCFNGVQVDDVAVDCDPVA